MMIATPQLTEPPAPDLIGRPERNGGGDRGRQSALALHCMPLDARPLHDPPRRLTKISKKKNSVPAARGGCGNLQKWLHLQVVSVQYLFTLLSFSTTT
jgi:hypothetical protein